MTLDILDTSGRHVARLADGEVAAGEHVSRWEGRDAGGRRRAAGVYFAGLTASGSATVRKLGLEP